MSAQLDQLLGRLEAVRKNGSGYVARCPAHPDNKPSLSVSEKDGRILVHCFAGCDTEAVMQSLSLAMTALFAPDTRRNGAGPSLYRPARETASTGPLGAIESIYDYEDEYGDTLYQVIRYLPKTFRQRRSTRSGGWTYSLGNVRRVPYRLSGLIEAIAQDKTIFIVEGEKDADCLHSLGIAATCNAGGADNWRDDYNETLRGADVVILPDNDAAGRKHAAHVARSLDGIARSCRVLELPGLADKGDIADWMANGHTVDELQALTEEAPDSDEWLTQRQLDDNELIERIRESQADEPESDDDRASEEKPRFRLISVRELGEIIAPPPLIEGVLGQGGMSAIVAAFSTFKSFIALSIDLAIAHGLDWFGHAVTPGRVVYQAGEGASGLYRRIEAWRTLNEIPEDCGMISFLPQALKLNDARDLDDLLAVLRWLPETPCKLTIDTLARSIRGNENSADDTGLYVEAVDAIREATGAHVQLIHHTGWEGTRSRGSSNIPASLDTEISLSRDGDRVTVTCTKMKDGAEFAPLTLESVPVAESLAFRPVAVTSPKLSDNERTVLEALPATAKLTAATWQRRSGIPPRSFYRCLNRLRTLAYVRESREGYETTEAGTDAL